MQTSLIKGLLHAKCPQCRKGDLFTHPLANIVKFNIMNETCPHCGVRLEPEPGFYQGAMYVGYALSVAVTVLVFVLVYLLNIASMWTPVAIVAVIMVVLVPINYRYSRTLYLYLFGGITYKPTHL
jgi:uncharacterized protein (DUF983 family)